MSVTLAFLAAITELASDTMRYLYNHNGCTYLCGILFGIFFFTFFGIGSVSQLIAGYVADVYSLDVAFYLLTIFAAVALLLSFKLPEEKKKSIEQDH